VSLELVKVMVQPVAIERDADGTIIGERVGDPVALFTPEQLPEYVAQLRQQIEAANQDGASPGESESLGGNTIGRTSGRV
jgi:hypothetical protein